MLAQAIAALAAGTIGALIFSFAHLPVPWLLGSIAGTALTAMLGARSFRRCRVVHGRIFNRAAPGAVTRSAGTGRRARRSAARATARA